jgi:phosphoribosyl-dephospho-CoA transferase
VVVRRAESRGGLNPVGVRGATRAERHAAWLNPRQVRECLTPAQLVERRGWAADAARCARVPALAALDAVGELMGACGLTWGPCGSVGFELASGIATATPDSDLDLLVEAPAPIPMAAAACLLERLGRLRVRVDAQLESPHGACALAEYAAGRAPLVLRTVDGPRLVRDPWAGNSAAA